MATRNNPNIVASYRSVGPRQIRTNEKVQVEIDSYQRRGRITTWDNLQLVSDEFDTRIAIWKTADGVYLKRGGGLVESELVVVDQYESGRSYISARFDLVSLDELNDLRRRAQHRDERRSTTLKAMKKYGTKKGKVDAVPVTRMAAPLTDRQQQATLDNVVSIIADHPDIEVTVARSNALIVWLPPQGALHNIVDAMGLPEPIAGTLHRSIRHEAGAATLLLRLVCDLEGLALEYFKSGKRPKADDKTGLANRLSPTGAWLA